MNKSIIGMERTKLEKFILLLAYAALIGGTLVSFLVSKCILESNVEMCAPQAIATFIGGVAASVVIWAVLAQIVKISDRLRNIENKLDKN